MTQFFARIASDVVAEIIELPDGVAPATVFSAALLASLEAATSTIVVGQTYAAGGFGPSAAAPAPTQVQLIAYAEQVRNRISTGGISVNVAAAGAPAQMVEVGTDVPGLAFLANAVQLTTTVPGAIYDWDQNEPVNVTGAQVLQIQAAVGLLYQACFSIKTQLRAAINSGAITTTAQIDSPPSPIPAWPANS
jgi:hypothetical protein